MREKKRTGMVEAADETGDHIERKVLVGELNCCNTAGWIIVVAVGMVILAVGTMFVDML